MGAASQEACEYLSHLGWAPIHVHVHGIRNAHGTVKASLYGPDPNTFLVKGKKADKEREPAERRFHDALYGGSLIMGRYAVVGLS